MLVSQCPLSRRELVGGRLGSTARTQREVGALETGNWGSRAARIAVDGCYGFTLARTVDSRCRISGLLLSSC